MTDRGRVAGWVGGEAWKEVGGWEQKEEMTYSWPPGFRASWFKLKLNMDISCSNGLDTAGICRLRRDIIAGLSTIEGKTIK